MNLHTQPQSQSQCGHATLQLNYLVTSPENWKKGKIVQNLRKKGVENWWENCAKIDKICANVVCMLYDCNVQKEKNSGQIK